MKIKLFVVLLIILISSLVWGYTNEHPKTYFQDSNIVHQPISASSANTPEMDYYRRKWIYDYGWEGNQTINLRIWVTDSMGVDTVLIGYSYDNVSWQNSTMRGDTENQDWYEVAILVENISSENEYQEFYVQYTANDTLGYRAITEVCVYGIRYFPYTVDFGGYSFYDTPDLWYIVGTSDHSITWKDEYSPQTGTSAPPFGGPKYVIKKDGHFIESWYWNHELTILVDGLSVGNHVYELITSTLPGYRESVTVHVVETIDELPTGVSTLSVGPHIESEGTVEGLFLTGIIGVSSAVLILFLYYQRKQRMKSM